MAVSRVVVVVVVAASSVAQEARSIMARAENRDVRMSDFFITIVSSLKNNSSQVALTDVLKRKISLKSQSWPAVA
jgi:hypothetical protein